MRYLLDTNFLAAYVQGRPGAIGRIRPWLLSQEVATSMLVYAEVEEYLLGLPDSERRRRELRILLRDIRPYGLNYAIVQRYAQLRRVLRPPHGPGLIGDIDTFIAATALEHHLTLVTTDGDFTRVPGLSLMHFPPSALRT